MNQSKLNKGGSSGGLLKRNLNIKERPNIFH